MKRFVTAKELRELEPPSVKGNGFDRDATLALLDVAADTIDHLEGRIAELQRAVAMARAESAPMEITPAHDDTDDVFTEWLANLDPIELDREVQKSIAETMVEATLAARQIRSEAQDRIKALTDAVCAEVHDLMNVVAASRGSLEAMHQLPNEIAAWEGRFSSRIGRLMEQLQLPWTAQVSQLARLLTHMAERDVPRDAVRDVRDVPRSA
ncbi:MAG: hypothetical protein ACOYNI_11775 [Acidimicrobiia bacterium]